jgi:hypothetical protein
MGLRTWLNPFGLEPPPHPDKPPKEPGEAHGPDLLRWFRRRRRRKRGRHGA